MKILLVTHYWFPHNGGIERVAYEQAKRVSKRGMQVTVLTSDVNNGSDYEKMDDLYVHRVRAINYFENKFGVPYPFFFPKIFSQMDKLVKEADIVHAHGKFYISSYLASRYAKKYKKPFVLTQHVTDINYDSVLLNFAKKIIDKLVGEKVLKNADEIVSVSKVTRNFVGGRGSVIYNGIDQFLFKPLEIDRKVELRMNHNMPLEKFLVLYIGRLNIKKKGIDILLEAAKLLKSTENIIFIIGGEGGDKRFAEEFIKANRLDNCLLVGFTHYDKLPDLYSLSDVFVLPSRTGEGLPLTVLEAFASGLPVIATYNSGGHVEIINEGRNGFLIKPNSSEDLAEKISKLFENPTLCEFMGKNGRKLIENELTWDRNIEKLIDVYTSVYEF
jgi:glycosyltransferase involved in cell wall biosynthesis